MSDLPTTEDLRRLTLRAIAAYAARCARRVQPLYESDEDRHVEAVDKAICVAEAFARGDKVAPASACGDAALAALIAAAADALIAADAARRDYDYLAAHHPRTEDILGEPIDPSEDGPLGPLWPGGAPKWFKGQESSYPQDSEYDCGPLEFLLDPGNATAKEIAEVFCEMSKLYEMMGGRGIQFTVTDCREPVVQEDLT